MDSSAEPELYCNDKSETPSPSNQYHVVEESKETPLEKEQSKSDSMSISDDDNPQISLNTKAEGVRKTMTFLGSSYLRTNTLQLFRDSSSKEMMDQQDGNINRSSTKNDQLLSEGKKQKDFSGLKLKSENRGKRLKSGRKTFYH
mmetsp:Transcript_32258/g.31680  ORF Transcript_32258/g.31680 Transcript_32258/m.31680 type:complete len:144 (-) Transcript_32258:13-444(-)